MNRDERRADFDTLHGVPASPATERNPCGLNRKARRAKASEWRRYIRSVKKSVRRIEAALKRG